MGQYSQKCDINACLQSGRKDMQRDEYFHLQTRFDIRPAEMTKAAFRERRGGVLTGHHDSEHPSLK